MARQYICKGRCGKKLPLEEMLQISGQNYCRDCYKKITKEREDRKELHDTIKELFNITMPTMFMLRQIKEYEAAGLTLKGMTLTLRYCKDIKKMSFNHKYGVTLISYYYEEAKDDYIKRAQRAQNHQAADVKMQTVIITKIRHKNYKKKRLINMEEII